MSTSFEEVYCFNSLIMNDSRIKNLTDDRKYFLLYYYLRYAVSNFNYYCLKDLTDNTPYSRSEYMLEGDGITSAFVLSPSPVTDSLFYVSIGGSKTIGYSFNSSSDTITFDIAPPKGEPIYVVAYIIGEFTETLSDSEIKILAEGMTVPFAEYHQNKTKALDQIVYTKDFNSFSQANHNKIVLDISNANHRNFISLMNEYSYMEPSDPTDLDGLAGDSTRGVI